MPSAKAEAEGTDRAVAGDGEDVGGRPLLQYGSQMRAASGDLIVGQHPGS